MDPQYLSGYELDASTARQKHDGRPSQHPSRQSCSASPQSHTSSAPHKQSARAPTRTPKSSALTSCTTETYHAPFQITQSIGPAFTTEGPAPERTTVGEWRQEQLWDREPLHQPLNVTVLYPQASSIEGSHYTFGGGAFHYEQPSTSRIASSGVSQLETSELATTSLRQSPEFLPTGRAIASDHNSLSANGPTFDNEQELRLFAEATAGLDRVPSMDQRSLPSISPSQLTQVTDTGRRGDQTGMGYVISPTAAMPSAAMQTLQHRGQLSQNVSTFPPDEQDLQSFGPDFDSWSQFPQSHEGMLQQSSMLHVSWQAELEDWRSVSDVVPVDDDLPDYTSSQAHSRLLEKGSD